MVPTLVVFIFLIGLLLVVFTGENGFEVTYNASHNYPKHITLPQEKPTNIDFPAYLYLLSTEIP